MFFNFEANLIDYSFGKVVFQILVTWLFSRNENSFFGLHFETKHFLIVLFADIWLFWVYTHMVQVSYRNSYGKVLKNGWVQVDPLVHKREWKVA